MTRACSKSGTTNSTLKVQILDNSVPKPSQNLVSSYKHKTKENLNKQPVLFFNESEVISFFRQNSWPEIEARKFYVFIKSKKWKTDNWQTIARIFAKNDFELKEPKMRSPISGYVEKLRNDGDKDD